MRCRCFTKTLNLARQAAEAMVGLPDYDAYLAHMRARHPEAEPLSRDAFFRNRQSARYGTNGALKCC